MTSDATRDKHRTQIDSGGVVVLLAGGKRIPLAASSLRQNCPIVDDIALRLVANCRPKERRRRWWWERRRLCGVISADFFLFFFFFFFLSSSSSSSCSCCFFFFFSCCCCCRPMINIWLAIDLCAANCEQQAAERPQQQEEIWPPGSSSSSSSIGGSTIWWRHFIILMIFVAFISLIWFNLAFSTPVSLLYRSIYLAVCLSANSSLSLSLSGWLWLFIIYLSSLAGNDWVTAALAHTPGMWWEDRAGERVWSTPRTTNARHWTITTLAGDITNR